MSYQLIYADPPWKFNSKKTGGNMTSGAASKYRVTDIKDLKKMNIPDLCAKDALLVMWWVGAMPQEALDLTKSWGFKVKNMNGFVWEKLTVKNNPFFGMGFYTRAGSETALIATRGRPEIITHSVRAVHRHKILSHSEKPPVFRDLAQSLVGDVPRLEMFARQKTEGWDVFGDQIDSSVEVVAA